MGGSSGGIIIKGHAVVALTDPIVHGQLPSHTCAAIDPILETDPSQWSNADCILIAHAFSWALTNLA